MSRIGRKAITLPKGVDVTVNGQHVTVKGAKGTLEMDVMHNISVAVADGTVSVTRANDDKAVRAAHGMTRALINNMVVGVTEGFQKVLEIVGVGYRAQMQGKNLVLSLGFSHPVEVVRLREPDQNRRTRHRQAARRTGRVERSRLSPARTL